MGDEVENAYEVLGLPIWANGEATNEIINISQGRSFGKKTVSRGNCGTFRWRCPGHSFAYSCAVMSHCRDLCQTLQQVLSPFPVSIQKKKKKHIRFG